MNATRYATHLLAIVALSVAFGCNGSNQEFRSMEEAASRASTVEGTMAPSFTLPNQDDVPVSLADYRGQWVVLYFYPEDDTPGCVCQATEFTSLLARFRDMNATILGVSDNTPSSHRRFIKKYDLKLTLLSDPNHDVMKEYGAWTDQSIASADFGRVNRTTFIIGPDGRIRKHYPEVIPKGHAERVHQTIQQLQSDSRTTMSRY